MARYEDLPYRTCVGMMLINKDGLVFIGRRAGGIEHVDESHVWQIRRAASIRAKIPGKPPNVNFTKRPACARSKNSARSRTG
jgi:hypothetical protein